MQDFLSGAASAATLILAVIGFCRWLKRRRAGLYYCIERFSHLRYPPEGEGVSVRFANDALESDRMYTDVVLLLNRTGRVIDDTDFAKALVHAGDTKRSFKTKILYGGELATLDLGHPEGLRINDLLLQKDEGILFTNIHDGSFAKHLNGVSRSSGELKVYKSRPNRTADKIELSSIPVALIVGAALSSSVAPKLAILGVSIPYSIAISFLVIVPFSIGIYLMCRKYGTNPRYWGMSEAERHFHVFIDAAFHNELRKA